MGGRARPARSGVRPAGLPPHPLSRRSPPLPSPPQLLLLGGCHFHAVHPDRHAVHHGPNHPGGEITMNRGWLAGGAGVCSTLRRRWGPGGHTLPAHTPAHTPTSPTAQANDGNGDQQQRTGMENAAQITAASTRAARLAQVRGHACLPVPAVGLLLPPAPTAAAPASPPPPPGHKVDAAVAHRAPLGLLLEAQVGWLWGLRVLGPGDHGAVPLRSWHTRRHPAAAPTRLHLLWLSPPTHHTLPCPALPCPAATGPRSLTARPGLRWNLSWLTAPHAWGSASLS